MAAPLSAEQATVTMVGIPPETDSSDRKKWVQGPGLGGARKPLLLSMG